MDASLTRIGSSLLVSLLALIGMQASCTSSSPVDDSSAADNQEETVVLAADGRPVGWTDLTHGKDATPDYGTVFPQGKVNRIDVTISAGNWQAMLDDMTTNYGQFGQGSQGGNGVPGGQGGLPAMPTDMSTACLGLQAGNACSVSFNNMTSSGICTAGGDGVLLCRPQMGPGGDGNTTVPPEVVAACATLQAGDACTATLNGMTIQGTCTTSPDGQVACRSQTEPGGAPNGGGMLGNDDTNPVVVPCKLTFEDKTWWYVGIRFKGNSSLMSTWSGGNYKLPFRLDFDAFETEHPEVDNQRFFGFKELSLASNWSDPSYLREKVVHDIFREAGVPAPRTAFYRLYIDYGQGPTYFGLYAMAEIPDSPMLAIQFGDDSGNLYKPTSNWVTFNEDDFDKESNKGEADWSDVQTAIAALHADRTDAAAWRAGLEATFDVGGFLRWLAVNTVIVNWDTYGQMAHNYYLYANPNNGNRLGWIPWDNNMAMMPGKGGMGGGPAAGGGQAGLSIGLTEVGEQWPLIRYLMDDPAYQAAYISQVRTFVEVTFDVAAIQSRLQAEHDLIAPYVTGAEGEQSGYTMLSNPQEFDTALSDLLQFVAARGEAAAQFLDTVP